MLNYEQCREVIRKHADCKFTHGMCFYGGVAQYGETPLPRRVLRDALPADLNGDFFADLWSLGIEAVMHPKRHDGRYGLELIGGYTDRCGFEHYGGDDAKAFNAIENSGVELRRFNWQQNYIVAAHGMQQVDVTFLARFPEADLYVVGICEGEGWWGTLFFGLTRELPYVLRVPGHPERSVIGFKAASEAYISMRDTMGASDFPEGKLYEPGVDFYELYRVAHNGCVWRATDTQQKPVYDPTKE